VFKQPLRYNNFGGTIGGPVYFLNFGDGGGPAIYNGKDRTYFFFSQEFRRFRSSSIPIGVVATNAQRNGVFTTPITDPLTGLPFPGNVIPVSRFNPNSVALMQYILGPNEGANQYRRITPVAANFRQSIFRFDHKFSSTSSMMARYIQDNVDRNDPGGNIFVDPFVLSNIAGTLFPNAAAARSTTPGKNFVFSVKFAPTANIINEVAFDYAYNLISSEFIGTATRAGTPGFTSPQLFESNYGALPSITISNVQGLTFQAPQSIENPSYTFRDNLTWVKGRHNFKFGAFISREAKNENAGNPTNGSYSFNGTRSGNAFADFLLGLPNAYSEAQNEGRVELRYNSYEFYAQDSWKVTPRLTVDFGARYSIYGNPIEKSNYLVTFMPNLYDRSRQVTLTASGNNIVPNSGDRFNGIAFAGENSPYGRKVQSDIYKPVIALISTGDKFKPPQTMQYSLAVQRELFWNMFIELAYVGTQGRNLLRQINVNAPLPRFARTGTPLGNRNFYRPFVGYGNINERRTDGNSNYNSAQMTLRKRVSDGLQFGAVYTFSKNITDASTDRSDVVQDNRNPNAERGLSQFDRTHVFTANFLYDTPFGKNRQFDLGSVGNAILGGFTIAGVYTRQSGTPLTVTQGAGTYIRNGVSIVTSADPLDTLITVRPNLICDPNLSRGDRSVLMWFDTNCFDPLTTTSTSFGNSGRGIIRGPGIHVFDLSLFRTIRFTESFNVQLRAEAFNVFNMVNYGNPTTVIGNALFGRITTARDPRILQFGIKVNF
ncbi:MAG: hypothetical protein LC730_04480, partial [Acidobacteria bacterium]|nr:hypothetical protein [Acidobacteriota bacterium]